MAVQDTDFVTAEGLAKAISETVGMTRGGAAQFDYWKSSTRMHEDDATDVPMTVSSFATNAPIRQDGSGFVFSLSGFYQFDYEATVSALVISMFDNGMNFSVTAFLTVGGDIALSAAKLMNINQIMGNTETVSGSGEAFVQAGQRVELGVKFSKATDGSATYYPILNSASLTMKLT